MVYLEQAVALDPGNEMLKLQLARAYSAAGRASDGLELLRANFGTGSGNLEGRLVRLFGEARLGSTEQGKKAVADLLTDFPRDARALTGAAMYYQLVGDAPQVRTLLEQAVAIDERFVPARLLLAGALVSEGRSADAEQQLRQVHAIEPRNAQAVAALAQLEVARGAQPEAELLLREALAAAPVVPLQLMLAQLYMNRGQVADAADLIEKAQAAAPNQPTVIAARGVLALVQGKLSDAVTFLTDAVARLPGRLDLVLALAQAEIGTNRAADAVKRLRRAVDAAPQSLPVRLALGQAELRLGNAEEAMKIAKALQAEFARQAGGYLLEADVDVSRRQYDAAVESTRRAYEQDPSWKVATAVVVAPVTRSPSVQKGGSFQATRPWWSEDSLNRKVVHRHSLDRLIRENPERALVELDAFVSQSHRIEETAALVDLTFRYGNKLERTEPQKSLGLYLAAAATGYSSVPQAMIRASPAVSAAERLSWRTLLAALAG